MVTKKSLTVDNCETVEAQEEWDEKVKFYEIRAIWTPMLDFQKGSVKLCLQFIRNASLVLKDVTPDSTHF